MPQNTIPVTIDAAEPPISTLRVAAYCRVSTLLDSQTGSIENQREHYENYISSHSDWINAGIYIDDGISGTKMETRPELQRLLLNCKKGTVDLILTKSISRFARNTMDCLQMVRTLTDLGVKIFFEKENIRTGTMESELMLTLLAEFAQDESRSISNNIKWGIRKRFQDGSYKMAVAPYGYSLSNGQLNINPSEAEVVRQIFTMALSGHGMVTISKKLNHEGVPSPTGNTWSAGSLRQIIHNPVYKGDLLCQKTYKDENYKARVNNGQLDQYLCEGHHEAIISRDDFEKVQSLLSQRAKEAGYKDDDRCRSGHRYSFTGLLYCAQCGSVMHRVSYGREKVYWTCRNHSRYSFLCEMPPQPENDLRNAFINCLNKLKWGQRESRILDLYEAMNKKASAGENAGRLMEIEKEIQRLKEQMRVLTAAAMKEGHKPEKRAALVKEMDELTEEKARLTASANELLELKRFIGNWTITDDPAAFPENGFRTLVERCTVDSQKSVVFHFRCGLKFEETLISPR